MKGINRAINNESRQFSKSNKNCVFLSHRSVDKSTVDKIATYIENAGVDYYLDSEDVKLQVAQSTSDAQKITSCIQKGINESTHILCIISNKTFDDKSWWVPYEIGFSDKSGKEIIIMKIKANIEYTLPQYLLVKQIIESLSDLNTFLSRLRLDGTPLYEEMPPDYAGRISRSQDAIVKFYSMNHPLKEVLK